MLQVNQLIGFGAGESGAVPTMRGTPTVAQGNPTTTRTIAHTVDAANRNCLIVRLGFLDTGVSTAVVSGITWNGTALTRAAEGKNTSGAANSYVGAIWYLVAPEVGAFNVVVTYSVDVEVDYVRCENWQDVNPTTPIGGTAVDARAVTDTVYTANVAKTKTLSLVLGALLSNNTETGTPGTNVTEEVDVSVTGGTVGARAWLAKNTANGNMSVTLGASNAAGLAAAELNGDA
jgi:hypothetical protein